MDSHHLQPPKTWDRPTRSRSLTGDDVSLDELSDLEPTLSATSQTRLAPNISHTEYHDAHDTLEDDTGSSRRNRGSDSRRRASPERPLSAVYLGSKQLFLGGSTPGTPLPGSAPAASVTSLALSAQMSRHSALLSDEQVGEFDLFRQGLDDALGLDGRGDWLTDERHLEETLDKSPRIPPLDDPTVSARSPRKRSPFGSPARRAASPAGLRSSRRGRSLSPMPRRSDDYDRAESGTQAKNEATITAASHASNRQSFLAGAMAFVSNRVFDDASQSRDASPARPPRRHSEQAFSAQLFPGLPSLLSHDVHPDAEPIRYERRDSVDKRRPFTESRTAILGKSDSLNFTKVGIREYPTEYSSYDDYEDEDDMYAKVRVVPDRTPQPRLAGKSLLFFPPDSPLRLRLYYLLHRPWVNPALFILILVHTITLSVDSAKNIFGEHPDGDLFPPWGQSVYDFLYLAIFFLYTVEITMKIIVQGLIDDSQRVESAEGPSLWTRIKVSFGFATRAESPLSALAISSRPSMRPAPIVKSLTSFFKRSDDGEDGEDDSRLPQERAFLRSSWNRVDFLAVLAYWISLILQITGVEAKHKFFVVRAISTIRILRLLNLTHGTSAVLRGLKKAAPLLSNVVVFIGFFWVLFSIIGVQAFKSSLRRTCIWVDPTGVEANYSTGQFCGSYLHPVTLERLPYLYDDGSPGPQAKGFACPVNSLCVSGSNPYAGSVNFDNIFNALELVFVIMSANTFSDIMYYTMDTDYVVSSLFFICGIIVLTFWLANLLVAVIISSFKLAREEVLMERSSDGNARAAGWKVLQNFFDPAKHVEIRPKSLIGRVYHARKGKIWGGVVLASMIVQCTRTGSASDGGETFIYLWEIATAIILFLEVCLRFCLYLPVWRMFFHSKSNIIDSFLAVANVIIVLPPVHNHTTVYNWLTIFQIARFYRVAVSIEFARDLWAGVLGNYRNIFNLTLFYMLTTYLCSLTAAQMFRGVIPYESDGEVNEVSFYDLANAFIGMYTISSTENWTTTLYAATEYAPSLFAAACFAAFLIGWFIFSNFIIINLFIAVITENLELKPGQKRRAQIKAFISSYAMNMNREDYLSMGLKRARGYFTGKSQPKTKMNTSSDVFDLLLERKIVEDFLFDNENILPEMPAEVEAPQKKASSSLFVKGFLAVRGFVQRRRRKKAKENPFADITGLPTGIATDFAQDFLNSQTRKEERQRRYLEENPRYDVSLYYFKPTNRVRRFCQNIVQPSYDSRQTGIYPKQVVWYGFSTFFFAATIAMVVTSCVNTPLYFKELTQTTGRTANTWITYADGTFAVLFLLEAAIKIIADGFHYTPNAFTRSSWNVIDLIVLVSLWATFVSEAFFQGYVSRFVRAFVAFRALRLLSISANAQKTFHNVIIVGLRKIIGAIIISLCLLFPFSVWGLNIFAGKLSFCTDGNVGPFSECVDEYVSTPFNWDIYAPRAVTKTYYDFDSFSHSFLIMFEVISLEGWVDVLNSVMSITGDDSNPEPFASRYNGIFPILYNIVGTIFILTVFLSVIIKNYAATRGTAFLTDEQLTWYEVQKLLQIAKPSIKAPNATPGTLRHYLLRTVQNPRSWIYRVEAAVLSVAVILLLLEYYPAPDNEESAMRLILLTLAIIYNLLLVIKFYALGYRKFVHRRWNLFGILVTIVSISFTSVGITETESYSFYNFQKLGLVGMMLLWIPKSRRLDQLFKTASASLLDIVNLMVTWFVLFLVYAIAFNQIFGLTRIGPNGTDNINFRTVPKALVLLFRMSCGEGWNQILSDYLVDVPYCVNGPDFSNSDCGSKPFAYFLFITWNVLSMYIFVNMFVSLIFESFSYVFHHGTSRITKKDIRKFKEAWSEFDQNGVGYIRTTQLHKFLAKTEGYFSIRIYDGNYTVPKILERSMARGSDPYDVDIVALNSVLRNFPAAEFRHRRHVYDLFCAQALLEADPERGISFNALLRQFPLYKGMDYHRCLKLDDYLRRKMLMKKVEMDLFLSKLRGFLSMVYLTKQFAAHWQKLNPFDENDLSTAPNSPEDEAPEHPRQMTRQNTASSSSSKYPNGRPRGRLESTSETVSTSLQPRYLTSKSMSPRRKRQARPDKSPRDE